MQKINLDSESWIIVGKLPENLNQNFDLLWDLHPENYSQIKVYGKMVDMPRYTQTYMKNYIYSGVEHKALLLPDEFQPFLDWARSLNNKESYNQVLVNWYENGLHYISAHTDNEKQLVKEHPIVSISLGTSRTFRIRNKETNEIVRDINMTNKSYIIMYGKIQERYTHEVPKITGKLGLNKGRRINITLRNFN